MKSLFLTILAVGTLTVVQSHLLIALESTWGLQQSLENPLNSGSTDWFCHGASKNTDKFTDVQAGSTISVPIVCGEALDNPANGGSRCSDDLNAYHNGGGCALSIAYTNSPQISDFVMFSVNGQCPQQRVSMISFSVPSNLPAGDAVCAWTWIPDPSASMDEMYMNCFNCRIINDNAASGSLTGTLLKDHLWAVPGNGKSGSDRGMYKDVFITGPLQVQVFNSNPTTTTISNDSTTSLNQPTSTRTTKTGTKTKTKTRTVVKKRVIRKKINKIRKKIKHVI